jgi:hypothetical protein
MQSKKEKKRSRPSIKENHEDKFVHVKKSWKEKIYCQTNRNDIVFFLHINQIIDEIVCNSLPSLNNSVYFKTFDFASSPIAHLFMQ